MASQGNLNLGAGSFISQLHGRSKEVRVALVAQAQYAHTQYKNIESAINTVSQWEAAPGALEDCFVGINGLGNYGSRTISNISQVNGFSIDFDYYNLPKYSELECIEFAALVLAENLWLPEPSITVDSGRGCWMFWLYKKPIGMEKKKSRDDNLPRWSEHQRLLVDLLSDYGTDSACTDASRLTRLTGTVNSKNYAMASAWTTGIRYKFEDMIQLIRAQCPTTKPVPRPAKKISKGKRGKVANFPFTRYSLALGRMDDLRAIGRMRGGYSKHRRTAYFLFSCAASFYCSTEESLLRECDQFAKDHFKNPGKYIGGKVNIKDVARRLKAYRQRTLLKQPSMLEASDGRGNYYHRDNPYCIRTKRYISDLGITHAEMVGCHGEKCLIVLIDPGVKSERRTKKRREQGVRARADYLAESQHRGEQIRALRVEGLTIKAIAEKLGCGTRTVDRWLQNRAS
jgi:hypothetical protein